jgi:hypothetical protein
LELERGAIARTISATNLDWFIENAACDYVRQYAPYRMSFAGQAR